MRHRYTVFLILAALAALGAVVLAPLAAAGPIGMMGGGPGARPAGSAALDPASLMGWSSAAPSPGFMMGGGWTGTGMWGTSAGTGWLTRDPQALAAWTQLRADHLADMKAWYDTYKADLSSDAAQQALHDLWTEHWDDMQAFMQKYAAGADWAVPAMGMWSGWDMGTMMGGAQGWDASHMWGTGYGASWMLRNPGSLGGWLSLRTGQMADVRAWTGKHAGAARTQAARTSLQRMLASHRTQVKRFYAHHGLPTDNASLRYGAGGWMGMGGMWGGFGW